MNKPPLLYYRTKEQIEEYRRKPAIQKLRWLEAQMQFYHLAMSAKARKIRDRINLGDKFKKIES